MPLGSIDHFGNDGVKKTFYGARANMGGITVNKGISLSFDPSVLTCISCKNEYGLLINPQKPVIIFAGDQNFVPRIPTESGCVAVIRVKNATLPELVDLLLEIFDSVRLPHGLLILAGMVLYLGRVGTSMYVSDWLK